MKLDYSNNLFLNETYERIRTVENNQATFKHFSTAIELLGFVDTAEKPEYLTIAVLCKDVADQQQQKKIFNDVAIQYYGPTVPFTLVSGNKIEFHNGVNLVFDTVKWQNKKSYKLEDVVFVYVDRNEE